MPFAFTVNALLIQDIIDILLHAKRGIFTNCVAFFATCSYLTGIFIAIGHVRFQSLFFLAIYADIKAIERISLWIQVQVQQMTDQGRPLWYTAVLGLQYKFFIEPGVAAPVLEKTMHKAMFLYSKEILF